MRFLVTVRTASQSAQSLQDAESAEEAKRLIGPVLAQALHERLVSSDAVQVADDFELPPLTEPNA